MTNVQLNPPPPALMRVVNPLVRQALTIHPLAQRIGKVALVEVRGRHTGRLLRIPLGLHQIGGVPTAFTCRGWRLNFVGGVPVTVRHRGRLRSGTAVLVDKPPGAALRTALDQGASPFDLGLKIDKQHDPTVAELDASGLSMIQFTLEDSR